MTAKESIQKEVDRIISELILQSDKNDVLENEMYSLLRRVRCSRQAWESKDFWRNKLLQARSVYFENIDPRPKLTIIHGGREFIAGIPTGNLRAV